MEAAIAEKLGEVEPTARVNDARILRKLDIRLIPMLAVLYLMSFLDRGNIGNAKIEGLAEDLHMTGSQYALTLTVFFLTYAFAEVPSNLMLKCLKPSIWLPSIMVAWGTITTLMGIVESFNGLLVARLFLGLTEGGLYPGVIYYTTIWYSRKHAQFRNALFFSAASIAGAFSGLLAFAINKMDGIGNLAGWRWIFIIEGIATVVIAVMSFFLIYDSPEEASFLTDDEKNWVYDQLSRDGPIAQRNEKFRWKFVTAAFTDWQVLVAMFMNLSLISPIYAISLFLPTIINNLGYTSTDAQLLTIPIYISAAITAVVVAWYSDRHLSRSPFLFVLYGVIIVGYLITMAGAAADIPGLTYAGVFIVACGLYTAFPCNVTWISNNLAGSYKRAVGLAIHVGFGNLGGAMVSNFYRSQDSPKFLLGHGLSLMLVLIGLVAVVILRLGYQHCNRKRDELGYTQGTLSPEEIESLGDKAPTYRYIL
ncbi:high-affinity nicotinic acid transporter [Talaromyces proteolyticus]|uniref:High-affinity nicotinic acid transporter n=1 Tax=Talaromyces proteolyticus TaxID=1131652 RepID=A0AAD4KE58_9EURO|nr:high-affinity nicotinic acid transporter [Talaromyces proteolyticus]KAH8689838.1 high-affinity nicotinic acid transporter [Talaromyces proteolyticus]